MNDSKLPMISNETNFDNEQLGDMLSFISRVPLKAIF